MSASSMPQQPELLTSWKEIASYLGKGVRTVQRWEQQFGLPVRRPNEKAKGIVHATREELDRWLARQWSQRSKDNPATTPPDGVYVAAVQASIQQAHELRDVNRRLMSDLRESLHTFVAECQSLAQQVTRTFEQD